MYPICLKLTFHSALICSVIKLSATGGRPDF